MSDMLIVLKKELLRIFKDKKLVFSVFLLPVIIMVVIMSLVNLLMENMMEDIDAHNPIIYVQNEPESFQQFIDMNELEYEILTIANGEDRSKAEGEVLIGEADLIIHFPKNFDADIRHYQAGDEIPQIKAYYNASEDYSSAAYNDVVLNTLEMYRQTLLAGRVDDMSSLAIFTVNSDDDDYIIQDDEKANGKIIGMMLPYFITILLFAGAMGIGSDMIAGEKERGTMASLLVSPVQRSAIALGKVFTLMIVSGISSLIYVGVMAIATPTMMGTMASAEIGASEISLQMNGTQIAMMGGMLVALAFFYSTLIALCSVFAKSTKEASTYISPIYMIIMVIGMVTMFSSGEVQNGFYFIPVYNNAIALQGIFTQELTMGQYFITLIETLGIGAIFVVLIVKAFESEKIMSN